MFYPYYLLLAFDTTVELLMQLLHLIRRIPGMLIHKRVPEPAAETSPSLKPTRSFAGA